MANLSILFFGSLLLALPSISMASENGTDNCTSAELPTNVYLDAKVAPGLAGGMGIPGADSSGAIHINCTSLSNADTTACGGGGGWELTLNTVVPAATAYPNTYTYPGLNAGLGFQVLGPAGTPIPVLNSWGALYLWDLGGQPPVDGPQTVYARFRLVQIGASVTPGPIPPLSMFIACNGPEYANVNQEASRVYFSADVSVVSSTCTVLQADTLVTLPRLTRGEFDGVGGRRGSTPFNLDFQCDADAVATVFFTDITDQGNAGSVLVPAAGSTLAGVGVQLTSNGVPVALVPYRAMSLGGQTFPVVSPGSAQVINIPLAAEYVQTADSITSGEIQAQVMVTVAYQ